MFPLLRNQSSDSVTASHLTSFYAISVLALNNLETHNMKSTTSLKRSDFCFFYEKYKRYDVND